MLRKLHGLFRELTHTSVFGFPGTEAAMLLCSPSKAVHAVDTLPAKMDLHTGARTGTFTLSSRHHPAQVIHGVFKDGWADGSLGQGGGALPHPRPRH